jgi:hypothetical protein
MNSINNLFRAVKKLSFYIYDNKLDRDYYWEKINLIIPDKSYCNMSWKIDIISNDGIKICCTSAVYEYILKTFNIKPSNEEMIGNYSTNENLKEECGFFFSQLINIQQKYTCTLLRICQIAFNLGQYQALYNNHSLSLTDFFTPEINNYYTNNKLNYFYSYVNISSCDDDEIFTELINKIKNLIPERNNLKKKYLKYKKKYISLKYKNIL